MTYCVNEQCAPDIGADYNYNKTTMRDTFERKVDRCRSKELIDIIDNASQEHAVYLIGSLLETAAEKKESVRVVTGEFNPQFYSRLFDAFKKCFDAKVDVEVIVLDEAVPDNHPLKDLFDTHDAKILTIPAKAHHLTAGAPHLVLIGDKRYRFETDHSRTKAIASFNDPNTGEWLLRIYDWLQKTALGISPISA